HANIVAILARQIAKARSRLVISEHNIPSRSLNAGTKAQIIRLAMRWLYPWADAVVCVSRGIEDELKKSFGLAAEKLYTIYNPLDLDTIAKLKSAHVDHPWLMT